MTILAKSVLVLKILVKQVLYFFIQLNLEILLLQTK
jgi:hypothetical protein